MTVHKAQGSEFDEVWLQLSRADSRVLSRKLLYTGLTRARNALHLAGSAETIRAALARHANRVLRLGVEVGGGGWGMQANDGKTRDAKGRPSTTGFAVKLTLSRPKFGLVLTGNLVQVRSSRLNHGSTCHRAPLHHADSQHWLSDGAWNIVLRTCGQLGASFGRYAASAGFA